MGNFAESVSGAMKNGTFSHHYQGSIDFNTANTTCPAGMYFLIHPLVWINDERMVVHCLESGCIGLYIPSDLEISLGPRDIPRALPSGHLSGLGKSLGRRGCTTHSLIIGREGLISTLYVLLALQGYIRREWAYTALNRDELGCTSPPTSRFPSALEMSLGLRPRDISRASRNLLVVGRP